MQVPPPHPLQGGRGPDGAGIGDLPDDARRRASPGGHASFTIYHSHVPWFGTEHLHEPLDEYALWLEVHALSHTPERFRAWVKDEYRSDDPGVDPPPLSPGPRRPI